MVGGPALRRQGQPPGSERDVPSLGGLFEAAWVWVLSADVLSPRAKSVAGTGQAEPLECRSLGKAGHSGCYEANLASIKASFRAAKPFPYVSLWELQSSGEGLGVGKLRRSGLILVPCTSLSCGWPGSGYLTLHGEGWRGRACLPLWWGARLLGEFTEPDSGLPRPSC